MHVRTMLKVMAVVAASAAALALSGTAQAGGGCHEPMTTGAGTEVSIEHLCFSPTVVHVSAGDEVTWTNLDAISHAVTGAQGSFGDYDQFGLGESVTYAFEEPGVYPYFCVLHPTMAGTVVVEDAAAPQSSEAASSSESDAPVTAAVVVGALMLGVVGASVAPRAWRRSR